VAPLGPVRRGPRVGDHGDTGAGLGASHQTGWTALVADLITSPRFEHYVAEHHVAPNR
jgi:hypothetical protein